MFKIISVTALLLVLHTHSYAQKYNRKSVEAEAEFREISEKLKDSLKAEEEVETKEESMLDQLEQIDLLLDTRRGKLSQLNSILNSKNADIQKMSSEITSSELELNRKKAVFFKRINAIYKDSHTGNIDLLTGADDLYNLLKRYRYLSEIAENDKKLISTLEKNLASLKEHKQGLERLSNDIARTQNDLSLEISGIENEEQRKKELILSIRTQKNRLNDTIAELEESAGRIRKIIKASEEQAPTLDGLKKQKLVWPNMGMVVSSFGSQKHEKFDTVIYKKGIEISSAQGEPVVAVAKGKVIFADRFPGYGLMIIIDHGGKYYSLYAHLQNISVKLNDFTEAGRKIAEVGNSGLAETNKLYFELRHKGNALNPLDWLEKRMVGKSRVKINH